MLGAFRGSGAAARDPADRARAGKKSSRSAGTAPVMSAPRKSAGWFGGWAGGGSPSSQSGSGSESKRETDTLAEAEPILDKQIWKPELVKGGLGAPFLKQTNYGLSSCLYGEADSEHNLRTTPHHRGR